MSKYLVQRVGQPAAIKFLVEIKSAVFVWGTKEKAIEWDLDGATKIIKEIKSPASLLII